MSHLQVSGLDKSFGATKVLRGIDLDVPASKIVALLGSSGSGKTTLLRLVAGFSYPDAGRILIGGKLVAGEGARVSPEARRIGYVPQEGALFPHLNVAENICFGLTRAERQGGRLEELLQITGLAGLEGRYPHQLSGGQQQRTALARALAPQPAIVLLDEPFNALDLDLRRAVCSEVIAALRATRTTAILVTHDPAEAFASADLVAVMRQGRIAQCADPMTLYQTPIDAEAARLTGPSILLEATISDGIAMTVLGEIPLREEAGLDSGFAIAMLRPEQLAITRAGPGGESGVPARVIGGTFYGDHHLVTVETGGKSLPARIAVGAAPAPGATVRVSVIGSCMAFSR
jgi:iron(III) transport system ATP-binding protein